MRIVCWKAVVFAPLLLCVCAAVSGQPPQEREDKLSIEMRLAKGQRFRLEYAKAREDFRAGKPSIGSVTIISDIDVEVLSTDSNSCDISWTMRGSRAIGPDGKPMATPALSPLLDMFKDIPFEVRISAGNAKAELRNFDEIKPVLIKSLDQMDRLRAELGASPMSKEDKQKVSKAFESREFVEAILVQDVLFFFAFGTGEFVKGTSESTGEMEAFGVRVPSKVKVTVTVNEAGNAVIDLTQNTDSEKLVEAVDRLFAKIGADPNGMPTAEEMKKMKISIDDSNKFVIDLKSGLPQRVSCKRVISASDGTRRVETREIARKQLPPATQPAQQ